MFIKTYGKIFGGIPKMFYAIFSNIDGFRQYNSQGF